jgi:hypothetical protein
MKRPKGRVAVGAYWSFHRFRMSEVEAVVNLARSIPVSDPEWLREIFVTDEEPPPPDRERAGNWRHGGPSSTG